MNLRKIFKLAFCSVLIGSLLSVVIPVSYSASATTSISVEDENGRAVVSIKALCEAMNGKITTVDKDGLTIYEINGKSIYIYDNSYCAFIDGEVAPYETEELADSVDNKKFNWPKSYKPTKTEDGYLIPVDFFEAYVNITNEGGNFTVSTEEEKEEVAVVAEEKDEVIVSENPESSDESDNQENSTGESSTSSGSTWTRSTPTQTPATVVVEEPAAIEPVEPEPEPTPPAAIEPQEPTEPETPAETPESDDIPDRTSGADQS
ncbi:hypothetical protein [Clostridium vincentii]|uniref:Uncharacterized protein n=1 Tax=Clostridium vincentii TaxID=52704 RepID=A0A2T0B8S3_9CLOT|nr:hypothetical protein [Clostridium vincentii]PRR80298.1 hypothetical protein CLVI_30880 [Clostridium vincentii]